MKRQCYFVVLLAFPGLAHAYIDPGTGSLLIQGLIAAFVSVMVFWRNLRMSIMDFLRMNFFRGKKQEETSASSPPEENLDSSNSQG
ncbi:MAG: hypothetical protein FWH15_04435 [Betaproteobacteria bacterium]|nr:hypothetical protein [Betaproteobacteria bacterium]